MSSSSVLQCQHAAGQAEGRSRVRDAKSWCAWLCLARLEQSWGCTVTAGWSCPPVDQGTADMAMVAVTTWLLGDRSHLTEGFFVAQQGKNSLDHVLGG